MEKYLKPKEVIGQKFGRLTVADIIKENGKKYCICNCDCGTKNKKILYSSVIRGTTKSCGCIRSEKTTETKQKHNSFELFDTYGIGYTDCSDICMGCFDSFGRNYFYFDIEDYDKIKNRYWKFNDQDYVVSSKRKKLGETGDVRLHRIIMGLTKDDHIDVDHIRGDDTRNDNRKSNLRLASRTENNMNIGVRPNNTSGVTGVSYRPKDNKWEAYITKNKKCTKLGLFSNFDDAVNARKEAEKKMFGEWQYSYCQSLKEGLIK